MIDSPRPVPLVGDPTTSVESKLSSQNQGRGAGAHDLRFAESTTAGGRLLQSSPLRRKLRGSGTDPGPNPRSLGFLADDLRPPGHRRKLKRISFGPCGPSSTRHRGPDSRERNPADLLSQSRRVRRRKAHRRSLTPSQSQLGKSHPGRSCAAELGVSDHRDRAGLNHQSGPGPCGPQQTSGNHGQFCRSRYHSPPGESKPDRCGRNPRSLAKARCDARGNEARPSSRLVELEP